MATCVAVFAYGGNLDPQRMAERVGSFNLREYACLKNWKVCFEKQAGDGSGYANIVKSEGDVVEGALYEIEPAAIRALDRYEGVASGHYRRVKATVITKQSGDRECWLYVAEQSRCQRGLRPRREYLNHLLKGQDIFTSFYTDRLRNVPVHDSTQESAERNS
ncbi:hypothetical protein CYMTET_8389 [Cymbomonas tetramitiformis]|uniref:gamma-glutamylcyclotransferase n=1 Tax=Cymbomonas tetramitiformis TaxID=36881 RepID=A0AAE0GTK8_9CHLO|nr:hypothetical protein CYMTET_8389 [Cymbomonas tetramitiformis]